ncbi:MAG: hypothetical protein ONA69_01130 [candidate division KSB1 bacterium]|nr:hypothetical protein [candidate division KSB1 bacterium]MDZ7345377.1 hypothetical protein [candidate division KSB1 bacterium]
MTIVFYISGHGYGHAVRDIEIIKELLRQRPDAVVHVRTAAWPQLFDKLPKHRVVYHRRELDFGIKQPNSFDVDCEATLLAYAELIRVKERLISEEIAFLHSVAADLIVSDITPFAFDAAAGYGKPATAVGNFSWDWIYADYVARMPQYAFVVEDIRASYRQAARLLRLPFYGDMSAFAQIEDVPLVARLAERSGTEVRRLAGMTSDEPYLMLGLRMADMESVEWRRLDEELSAISVAVGRDVPLQRCLRLDEQSLTFEEILAACDAVLSKPGYSMVAESLANRTPLLYVRRRDNAEDAALIDGLQRYGVCEELAWDDFLAGRWCDALRRLLNKPQNWPPLRIDGAAVIAEKLLSNR